MADILVPLSKTGATSFAELWLAGLLDLAAEYQVRKQRHNDSDFGSSVQLMASGLINLSQRCVEDDVLRHLRSFPSSSREFQNALQKVTAANMEFMAGSELESPESFAGFLQRLNPSNDDQYWNQVYRRLNLARPMEDDQTTGVSSFTSQYANEKEDTGFKDTPVNALLVCVAMIVGGIISMGFIGAPGAVICVLGFVMLVALHKPAK